MNQDEFAKIIAGVTATIVDRPLDAGLEVDLNTRYPAGGATFQEIQGACRDAVAAGWMCSREAGGIRFGRVLKPTAATHGFSVDVVEMNDVIGPHHVHPKGEIDLVLPLDPAARFDGRGAGWKVYAPGSAHSPTVTQGRAWVLYLLPDGEIEFSRA